MSNNKETEKICTGCGRSSFNPVSEQHLACCPDSNYVEMSNNKGSIEWLMEKLIEHQIIKVGQTTYGGNVNYKHEILFEQAKAMRKDEMIQFAIKCMFNSEDIGSNLKNHFIKKYNEEFGGKNEQN